MQFALHGNLPVKVIQVRLIYIHEYECWLRKLNTAGESAPKATPPPKVDTSDDHQENGKDVLTWNAEKVAGELQKFSPKFAKYRQKFIEKNVNGALLQSIVDDTGDEILRSVGMVTAQV